MKEHILKTLGKNIRLYRKKRKLTQEMLGERAGICPKYLGEIERGETNPTLTVIYKIACALEKNITDLVCLDLNPSGKNLYLEKITELLSDKEEAFLCSILKAMEILLGERKS